MSEKTLLHVEGMTCANCAATISRTLKKEGLQNVDVNYLTTEVSFDEVQDPAVLERIRSQIHSIGYHVREEVPGHNDHAHTHAHEHAHEPAVVRKFWWSTAFTVPLLVHMIFPGTFLHEPLVQLFLCIPVMIIGLSHFGKSAWGSLKAGMPNMDVLIFIGSTAAFIYSIIGMYLHANTHEVHRYLFFETAASIITFVLLGNVLEQRSVRQTTSALHELSKLQPQRAKKISTGHQNAIVEVDVSEIKKSDLLFVGTGDRVPADGVIVKGKASLNESMITGESLPVTRREGERITGGTVVEDGSFEMRVEAVGQESALAKIIRMVKDAQQKKPAIQRLGDRVSAAFVPAVLVIAAATFLVSWLFLDLGAREGIMRAIAVLVISCPCAMGLATPTALMVGIGRAARSGILIKGGDTVEEFSNVKTVMFDKTGVLTTGKFKVTHIESDLPQETVRGLLLSIEQHSSHPIAQSIVREFGSSASSSVSWKKIEEDKGVGINATDSEGNLYSAGSHLMAAHATGDDSHNIYLLKNNKLIATVDLEDEIKPGAKEMIGALKGLGKRVVLVSGDRKKICESVAQHVGIDEVYSQQLPAQKLQLVEKLTREQTTAMVGDGINDAPALAKARVGVSFSGATQVAIQSAQIILLKNDDLRILLDAYRLSRHTLLTIKQNLFWAFAYNVVAIPIAAAGLLSPAIGALSMAFSDAVLIGNSIRLRFKSID